MQRAFANMMLCLLLLLSVGSVRCESRCVSMAMPQAAGTVTMAMESSMEYCDGMQSAQIAADAACDGMICSHHALPVSVDAREPFDTTAVPLLEAVALQVETFDPSAQRVLCTDSASALPPRPPLDPSTSLRV